VFVAINWGDLWLGVKDYAFLVIAGFLRKLFR